MREPPDQRPADRNDSEPAQRGEKAASIALPEGIGKAFLVLCHEAS